MIFCPQVQTVSKSPWAYRKFLRYVSALKRASADFDQDVIKNLEDNNIRAKKHPGIMPHAPSPLPTAVKTAIDKLLKDGPQKQLLTESKEFKKYVVSRESPKDRENIRGIKLKIEREVKASMGVDENELDEDELKRYIDKKNGKVNKILHERVYNWNRLDFTRYVSLLYLVSRSTAEYSAVHQVLSEISQRSGLKPTSIFDFGSGLGTVTWAANNLWGKSLKEYYCVDSSAEVHDIAKSIINQYKNDKFSQKIFQRQFLPSSNEITSDIVISAYSLMELPSSTARRETVKNLWERTKNFFILIELGTKPGFSVINEARETISSEYLNSEHEGHIFAPCPHDLKCPRAPMETKCFFESSYFTYPQKPEKVKREYFSYLVFQKGRRSEDGKNWPRIVQPVLCRSRHAICRFCTPTGELQEVIFTATKHGKIPYKCARASRWGDLFPCETSPKEEGGPPQEEIS